METLRTLTTEILNDGVSYHGVVAYNREWSNTFGKRHVVVLREREGKPIVYSVLFEQQGNVQKETIGSCGRDSYERKTTIKEGEGGLVVQLTTFKVNISAKPRKAISPEYVFCIHEIIPGCSRICI